MASELKAIQDALSDPAKLAIVLKNVDVNYKKRNGARHPLQMAVRFGYTESAKLLATKANILHRGQNGWDAMDEACAQSNYELLTLFFQICNIQICSTFMLGIAARRNNVEMGKFLLQTLGRPDT